MLHIARRPVYIFIVDIMKKCLNGTRYADMNVEYYIKQNRRSAFLITLLRVMLYEYIMSKREERAEIRVRKLNQR